MASARRIALALSSVACFAIVLSRPLAAAGLPEGDPKAAGFAPEKLALIRTYLERQVAEKNLAGGATLIARHGKVVHQAAVGMKDVEAGQPLERSTLFRIASMTKPITSTAVMILVDEGKLRLDDPVAKYLHEFAAPSVVIAPADATATAITTVPAASPITIHQLLTHSSGLSYRFAKPPQIGPLYVESAISDGLSETPGTIGDNVKRLARLPLLHQPGTTWSYSLSTDVLGRLVEVVSGQTFDQFLRERIFTPLAMDDTQFVIPKAKRGRLAALYTAGEDKTVRRSPGSLIQDGPLVYSGTYSTWDDGHYYSGGAGLTSTIDDYSRFCQMLLNKGELDGARILKPETVALMTRDQVPGLNVLPWGHGDGFGYGFGVVKEANRDADLAGVGAYSWGGFFYTYFWVDPKREIVAIFMTQLYPNAHLKVREEFKRLAYDAIVE
ncbi:serine hydrolase domain-containing protein [Singulisphaera rosea]